VPLALAGLFPCRRHLTADRVKIVSIIFVRVRRVPIAECWYYQRRQTAGVTP
jgi:hypothetical protein